MRSGRWLTFSVIEHTDYGQKSTRSFFGKAQSTTQPGWLRRTGVLRHRRRPRICLGSGGLWSGPAKRPGGRNERASRRHKSGRGRRARPRRDRGPGRGEGWLACARLLESCWMAKPLCIWQFTSHATDLPPAYRLAGGLAGAGGFAQHQVGLYPGGLGVQFDS